MNLLIQPNPWSCLPTCMQMVLNKSYDQVIEAIGHDGSQIIWPDLEEPFNRRGFVEADIIEGCLRLGYAALPIDFNYLVSSRPGHNWNAFTDDQVERRLDYYMLGKPGIIDGFASAVKKHACAWDGSTVYDPGGRKYTFDTVGIEKISITKFYLVRKLAESLCPIQE